MMDDLLALIRMWASRNKLYTPPPPHTEDER
jgi:hypothetical protein